MDPNRPNTVLYPRDDHIEYKGPRPYESQESHLHPLVPGQELFDQYKYEYADPSFALEDSSYFYIYISGQIEFSVFPNEDSLMAKYAFEAGKEWERILYQRRCYDRTPCFHWKNTLCVNSNYHHLLRFTGSL